MPFGTLLQKSWIRRVQSDFVLPTARLVYLGITGLCLLGVVVGILAAVYFEIGAHQTASQTPVPPATTPAPIALDLAVVDGKLMPPSNIRAVPIRFFRPVSTATLLVYFDADTGDGFARFPDDILILGGRDAALFDKGPASFNGVVRTALRPTEELVTQINAGQTGARQFEIRLAAKDSHGNISKPVVVRLTLAAPSAEQPAAPAPTFPEAISDLERLAQRIALKVDPQRTPVYFDAYKRAQQIPEACGAFGDPSFVPEFARAFEHSRSRLGASNIEGFYSGVCTAWRNAVAARAQESAASEAAREQILAENLQAEMHAESLRMVAGVERNAAISFVGGSLALFLIVSLLLAFLAMEGHSKAVREAVEILASHTNRPDDKV